MAPIANGWHGSGDDLFGRFPRVASFLAKMEANGGRAVRAKVFHRTNPMVLSLLFS
jgi:hypothetical protein